MHRLIRIVLTCLLFAAVPLQGYAATGMLFCGTWNAGAASAEGHHGANATAQMASGDGAHAARDDGAHHAAGDSRGTVAHAEAPAGFDLHHVAHGTCSACASCCSAAALPTAAVMTTAPVPAIAPAVEHAQADPGHGPARLERPPRFRLA